MARRDSNIDPFNAGEPDLPWSTPSGAMLDEPTPLNETPYEAPTKQRDSYRAPTDSTPSKSSKGKATSKSNHASRSASKRSSTRPNKARKAPSEPRMRESGPSIAATREASASTIGRRKFGLPRVIVILIIVGVVGGGFDAVGGIIDGIFGNPSSNRYDLSFDPDKDSTYESGFWGVKLSSDDAAKIAIDYAKENTDTADIRAKVTQFYSDKTKERSGYSFVDLGIDGDAFSAWALSRATYSKSDLESYVSDGYDEDKPYGSAYISASYPDLFKCWSTFNTDLQNYLVEQDIDYWDDNATLPELSEGQKAHVADLLKQAQDATAQTRDNESMSLKLTYDGKRGDKDGTWSVDGSDFKQRVEGNLGVY